MAKHAFLAASASERWLHCPPSALLCAQEDDQSSEYAKQGSDAHALAEYLLLKALGRDARDPTEDLTWYDAEMQEATEAYAAFVMQQDRKSTRLNSSHPTTSRMPSSPSAVTRQPTPYLRSVTYRVSSAMMRASAVPKPCCTQ